MATASTASSVYDRYQVRIINVQRNTSRQNNIYYTVLVVCLEAEDMIMKLLAFEDFKLKVCEVDILYSEYFQCYNEVMID